MFDHCNPILPIRLWGKVQFPPPLPILNFLIFLLLSSRPRLFSSPIVFLRWQVMALLRFGFKAIHTLTKPQQQWSCSYMYYNLYVFSESVFIAVLFFTLPYLSNKLVIFLTFDLLHCVWAINHSWHWHCQSIKYSCLIYNTHSSQVTSISIIIDGKI